MSITEGVDAATLGKLREDFRGQLILPGDRDYDASRIVWNAVADRYPALIARCTRVEDVIAAVRFAREHDLVIAVRGGGHSVAGFSTCDAGIVIDVSGMRAVQIDPASGPRESRAERFSSSSTAPRRSTGSRARSASWDTPASAV